MKLKRHDLLYLSNEGLKLASKTGVALLPGLEKAEALGALFDIGGIQIPAIVKRQEDPDEGMIEVGFSSHKYHDGSRIRVSSQVPIDSIVQRITPFDIMDSLDRYSNIPKQEVLNALKQAADEQEINLGIYGSTALNIITSLLYSREDSDLDIYIRKKSNKADIRSFYEEVLRIEAQYHCKIDMEYEIDIPNQDTYGVKLRELLSGQRTVLAKGFLSVELLEIAVLKREAYL